MKRLYYVTGTLDSVQNISRDLDVTGIDEGRMHVLGKDSGPVIRAQLHATTIWEDTEIMHAGFLGALFGALGGFIIGSALVAMGTLGLLVPWPFSRIGLRSGPMSNSPFGTRGSEVVWIHGDLGLLWNI